jgi:hypothetical protein
MSSPDDRRFRAISALGTIEQAEAEIKGWHRSAVVYGAFFPVFSLLEILDYIQSLMGPMSSTLKPGFLHPRNKWLYCPLMVMVALGPPLLLVIGVVGSLLGVGVLSGVSWKSVVWLVLAMEVGLGMCTAFFRHRIWVMIFQPDSGCWLELEGVVTELGLNENILPSMSSNVAVSEVTAGLVELRQSLESIAESS